MALEQVEDVDLSDLDLLDDPHLHLGCRCAFTKLPPPKGYLFVAMCGRRALARGIIISRSNPPADACPKCVELFVKGCPRCHP